MKPLRLVLQAFGPYAACQELDFADLGGQDFFLIHGPTGAGKTSLLDGLSYALYGETSGGMREAKDMRSHFADPTLETRVRFEFQLGTHIYRVDRCPEQMVPKQRGGGQKKQSYIANLWELEAGEATPLATEKPTAVDARVIELMGFKASQFRQVVLLPQGRFQEFMLAGSAERQAILQVLFQTERYARIAQALADEEKCLKETMRTTLAESQQLLEQVGVDSVEELPGLIREAERRGTLLKGEQEKVIQAAAAAAAALQEGLRASVLVKELQAAEAEREELASRAQLMEVRRTEQERALRAEFILPPARRLQEAQDRTRDLGEEEGRLAEVAGAMTRIFVDAEEKLAQADGQEIRREELRRSIARLKELEPKLVALEESRKEVRASALERGRLEDDVSEHRRRTELAGQELSRLQVQVQELRTETDQSEAREHLLYLVKKQRGQRDELERYWMQAKDAKEALEDAEGSLWAAKDERGTAHEAQQRILARRQEAQAASLARHLESGAPCPVCGSTEHPLPARSAADLPDEESIQAARDRDDLAEVSLARAQENATQRLIAYEGLRARTDGLLDALGDLAQQPAERFAAQEAERRTDLERSRTSATRLPSVELDVSAAENKKTATNQVLDASLLRLEELRTRETEAKAKVRFLEESLLSELRAPGALSTRREQAERELAGSERELQEARTARDAAQAQAQGSGARMEAHRERMHDGQAETSRCEIELDEAIAAARFRDRSDFELARRTPEEQATMVSELESFTAALQSAEDRLTRAQEQALGILTPDLLSLKTSVEAAQTRLSRAGEELGQVQGELASFQRVKRTLEAKDREIALLDRRYRVLGKLTRAAKGEEGSRISFERYVQGAILDEVLVSASERLRKMSKQRYALRRALGAGDLRRAGGLDLEVTDTHTGRPRAVSTLSGGEGFLASLALALGLSDVVQRNSGGIRLDTVFIDEGFGSLDQEALDLALRTLEELKQGGRLVGLISHLEEVKARIPARLEVIPGPGGSRAAFKVG